jgi:hypothetical protein
MDPDPTMTDEPPHRHSAARTSALPWILFAVALAVAAWGLWNAVSPRAPGDPLGTSLTAFEKQNKLTVFSAQLSPVVASDDNQLLGLLKSRQVAVIPARVDYTLDLSRMTRDRLSWDADKRRLDVLLPPLMVSRPNLDEGHAQYLREGVWITAKAAERMSRANTRLAEQQAMSNATNPALMGLARAAAKDAIRQNLAIPLQVAGFGDVTVVPRFDGEPASPPGS